MPSEYQNATSRPASLEEETRTVIEEARMVLPGTLATFMTFAVMGVILCHLLIWLSGQEDSPNFMGLSHTFFDRLFLPLSMAMCRWTVEDPRHNRCRDARANQVLSLRQKLQTPLHLVVHPATAPVNEPVQCDRDTFTDVDLATIGNAK
jgi:hypothetical protein